MRPKTFSEKWDKEENAIERGGVARVKSVRRPGEDWKKFIKYIVIAIIILIAIILILMAI